MSPDDTLRALLHDAAENAPAYRPVDVDAELPITAFRRWAVLGLVAAAFVVIAAGGLVLSRTNDNADVLPPISDSTAPVQPTPTGLPTNEASKGASPNAIRCPATDFRVAWFGSGVAAGSETDYFTITNTSSSTCSVRALGPSELQAVKADGATPRISVQAVPASDVQLIPTRALAPGQFGRFAVSVGDPGMCDAPQTGQYDAIRVDLGAAGALTVDYSDSIGGAFSPGCGVGVSGIGLTMRPGTMLPCRGAMSPSGTLNQTVVKRYGEIDDCGAIDGTWIVDTDEGTTGVGSVGVYVCHWRCEDDIPREMSDWTFYHVAQKKGTDERLTGVDERGILFRGAVGEVHFDPATGKWDVPVTLASPSR